ncbi:helix-turn-helix transcriptional regulator [Mycobacterium sp. HUMS_1102779]
MIEILIIWTCQSYDRNMYHPVPLVYDTIELGEHIRRARQDRGFNQDELANRIGVTRMTISRLERGESVSVDIALRALSECGIALALVPKFSRVTTVDGTQSA